MKPILFLDFDGTLINSHERCFKLFKELAPTYEGNYANYIELKAQGFSNLQILSDTTNLSADEIVVFHQEWTKEIEDRYRLESDTLFEGVAEWLTEISKSWRLVLCTARQSEENTFEQLKNLSIDTFFENVLITKQQKSKSNLIKESVFFDKNESWLIGDSPDDINTGKQLDINTCAVLTGFRNKETLTKYEPDLILTSVIDFSNQRV